MAAVMVVLHTILLLPLASSADVSVSRASADESEQCLMQKKHGVSKLSNAQALGDAIDKSLPKISSEEHTQTLDKQKGPDSFLLQTPTQHGKADHHHDKHGHHKKEQHVKKQNTAHKGSHGSSHKKGGSSMDKKGEQVSLAQLDGQTYPPHTNPLLDRLPEPILALGWKLFKTEGAIAGAVENSVMVNVTHAGVKMSLMMNKFDDATTRLGSEGTWFSYDLDTLGDERENHDDMLNMLDIGGNYGVVTIAAMKKYGKELRLVTVEPIPTTYFFLRWNLILNGVPEIDQASLHDKKGPPGVVALNSGSSDVAGKDLHVCSYPWSSMNSKVCDCPEGEDNCVIVPSTTVDTLASMFGNDYPIAMVKMDCEGCEFKSLPALAEPGISKRVRRLAGELHIPDQNLEELACRWNAGKLMSKCQFSKQNKEDVECGVKLDCPL